MKNILLKLFGISGTKTPEAETNDYESPADFEAAIGAAGFGKYNILLLMAAWPSCWASMFQTMTMSYVFPAAQCDLNLSLEDKGMLNAVTFAGMMASGLIWGYLYDSYGRRKLLCLGLLLDSFFVICSAGSQSFTFLMMMKFMGGLMISGPFSALVSYFSELHSAENRSRVPMIMGIYYATGGIYLPLLGSLIFPMNFKLVLTNNIVLHSWSLYLLINALPSFIGGVTLFFLPESPKFLMSVGKNDEALQVFKKMYNWNKGKPEETYPFKKLVQERKLASISIAESRWNDIKSLFNPPLLKTFILVCLLQVLLVASFNTLRLWMPQLFQAINDYKMFNNGTSATLCEMLSSFQRVDESHDCFVNFDNFEVYLNSMIVCAAATCAYSISGFVINILGQNRLLTILCLGSGIFAVAIYFAPNSELTTVFIAGCSSLTSVATVVSSVVIINQFPTKLRATTLALSMMFGRTTAMLGNVIFPLLLELGCAPPFFLIAALGFACATCCLILPKQNTNFE